VIGFRSAGFSRSRIEREQGLELGHLLRLKQTLADAAQRNHRIHSGILQIPKGCP